ncbi:hypothetical protein JCM33374_g6201 [Metschnikowia sp. JCM 33374]|nr:hypothetical protein JCM33374_g6201 [Metschnikowia sp. JCM 33374]
MASLNDHDNLVGAASANTTAQDASVVSATEPEPGIKREHPDEKPPQTVENPDPASNGVKKQKLDAATSLVVVPHKKPDLFYSPLKTGVVYDVRMRYHAKIFTSYFEYIDPHPEDPRRIYRIYKRLAEAGLIQDTSLSGSEDIGPLMVKIPIREATPEEILQVHTEEHLKYISSTEGMSRDQLLEETEKGDSIYVNNDSFLSAKLSCGGSIEACRAVVEGKVKNSFAIVRPPGHHAEPDTPGGFCLFSNVAVAAKNMLKSYPESVRRIVILDWDIHHGNGTQRAFYDDPRVLYISLHRFENGKFYPGTKYGGADMVGEGKGEGFSVNVPWQDAGVGDGDYVYAFHKIILPIMSEFDPDLVIVSSGFDAADGDIIGQCHVTPAGYGQLTHMLKAIAKGKLTVILEGGYNLDSISHSALGVAKVLVGEPPEATVCSQPRLDTLETVSEVIRIQSKYWKCMKPGNTAHSFEDAYDLSNGNLLSFAEPIRAYQAQKLFSNFSFISLPILDSKDEKLASFTTDLPPHLEDLVLASRDISTCNTVIISIHDPPEVWANVNPVNGNIDSNSSVVLEHPLPKLIRTVEKELESEGNKDKLGFIDINIPSYMEAVSANGSENSARSSKSNDYNPTIFSQELLLWVWSNYLSYFQPLKKVVFVGYGESYQSIVHLYAKRPSQEIKDLVRGTVVFANRTTLKPIVPVMDESMVDWFYQNSVVFAGHMNPCWSGASGKGDGEESTSSSRRPRKKFGRVLRANVDGLWDVINDKFDEGVDFILDSITEFSQSESG